MDTLLANRAGLAPSDGGGPPADEFLTPVRPVHHGVGIQTGDHRRHPVFCDLDRASCSHVPRRRPAGQREGGVLVPVFVVDVPVFVVDVPVFVVVFEGVLVGVFAGGFGGGGGGAGR